MDSSLRQLYLFPFTGVVKKFKLTWPCYYDATNIWRGCDIDYYPEVEVRRFVSHDEVMPCAT